MNTNKLMYRAQVVIFVIVTVFFMSSIGWAATYYVNATSGNDSNTGTSSAAWKTIQKAANMMGAGDTAVVQAGSYAERVQVTKSGSAGAPITYQANGTVAMRGFTITANYVQVSGFEITNTTPDSWSDSPGVYIKGTYNEVRNNYIHDVARYGIFVDASPADSSATSNCTVKNNRIVFAVEAGIRVMGANNLIEANDISHTHQYQPGVTVLQPGNDADGIRFFGSGHTVRKNYIHDIYLSDPGNVNPHIDAIQTWGPAYNIVFEQNTFYIPDNSMQGTMIEVLYTPVRDLTFRNNIFMNGSTGYGPGINIEAGYNGNTISNIAILNNSFIRTNGPAEYGVWLHNGVQNAKVMNNAFYDCGNQDTPYFYTDNSSSGGPTNSGINVGYNSVSKSDGIQPSGSPYPNDLWMVDPKFVNSATKDFHLQLTSPLINAGITLAGVVTNDYDGGTRPQGSGYDIGAFEFGLPSAPTNLTVMIW